jgi:hypothetical protein
LLRNLALKLSLDVLLRGFIENGARSELMVSKIPERVMHSVRMILAGGWLVLIASMFLVLTESIEKLVTRNIAIHRASN